VADGFAVVACDVEASALSGLFMTRPTYAETGFDEAAFSLEAEFMRLLPGAVFAVICVTLSQLFLGVGRCGAGWCGCWPRDGRDGA
jgi:hypothetical protein